VFAPSSDVIGPIGLGAAIGCVWLLMLGASLQLLMSAAELGAASQLLFFLNLNAPTLERATLAHRIIAP
jgi:hypothetical protein